MSVTIDEHITSRRGQIGPSAFTDLVYHAYGDTDDIVVRNAVFAAAPSTWDSQVKTGAAIEPTELNDHWMVLVRYETTSNFLTVGEQTVSGTTAGGSQHIYQSLSTELSVHSPGAAPDFKGAINVTENGPQGTEIGARVFAFEVRKAFANGDINTAFFSNIFNLTWTFNNAAWGPFAEGEAIFVGATFDQRSDGNWEFSFGFIASPNATSIPVGDLTVASKRGADFLWALYKPEVDATANYLVFRPKAAYVEQVYYPSDFDDLPIDPPFT